MFPYDEWEYGIVQLKNADVEKRDPSTVVAVILGGGAGTRLFPLTKRRAKPAVSFSFRISFYHFLNCSPHYKHSGCL